jgi:hypothetical protein
MLILGTIDVNPAFQFGIESLLCDMSNEPASLRDANQS